MLAACRRDRTAREYRDPSQGHGLRVFTGDLLDTLRSNQVNENTTFQGVNDMVAEKLRRFWQEPVAHGERKKLSSVVSLGGDRVWDVAAEVLARQSVHQENTLRLASTEY